MQLVAPDILTDAQGLSLPIPAIGIGIGLGLWALGWKGHRFWIVLFTTVLAGTFGLSEGASFGAQPLVAAVLLALAAGLLGLALARLASFVSGGLALLLAAQAIGPVGGHALLILLSGGILSLFLFRLWVMVLTSLGGTLLVAYSWLCLAEELGQVHASAWADANASLLNWLCGAAALLGVLVQISLSRKKPAPAKDKKGKGRKAAKQEDHDDGDEREEAPSWGWSAGLFRRAG
jgi:hypothetical protein